MLNASLSGLAENFAKRLESLAAREHRRERQYDADTAAIATRQEELLGTVGSLQQACMTVKRELERMAHADATRVNTIQDAGRGRRDPRRNTRADVGRAFAPALDCV